MKKNTIALFVAVAASFTVSLCASQAPAVEVQAPAKTAEHKQEIAANDQSMTGQPNMTDKSTMSSSCDNLPTDQKNFASQLNANNKELFCSKFSAAQRASAMQMAGTTGANGMKMSPDNAVEQTAKGTNAPMQKSAGGCPVR